MTKFEALNSIKQELTEILNWANSSHATGTEIKSRISIRIGELYHRAEQEFNLTLKKEASDQATYRRIVDRAWNECTESTTVPSTEWTDRIINKALHEN